MKKIILIIFVLVTILIGCDTQAKYSITYENIDNNGAKIVDKIKYTKGSTYIIKEVQKEVRDFEFVGWSYNNKIWFSGESITTPDKNITLVGTWNKKGDDATTFSITYIGGEGTTGEVVDIKRYKE
jgi:uncharacterized lipoprotein NlpE involved in copper resistance